MDNWYAKNASQEVKAASDAVRHAEKRLQESLEEEYPLGANVRVVHFKGQFLGTVDGHDSFGCRVSVRNGATGKSKKWWSAHVERLRSNALS